MKKRMLLGLVATVGLAVGATAGLAAVNQNVGIYDTKFGNMYRADCLVCHVSDTVLVTRHHALVQSANKQCLDCHTQIPDGTGGYYFADFRTCEVCHKTTPHHVTTQAAARDCAYCHGKFVDNYNDGHPIPTYAPSDVTPVAGAKVVDDAQSTDPTKTILTGGCGACHVADAAATPKPIFKNADTHHGTGLQDCGWCHDELGTNFTNIRTCETCHGIKSLHNIQVDSPNTANVGKIVSGGETKGWGHIGNNEDCWGCHGWYDKYAYDGVSPDNDAAIAFISGLSTSVQNSGTAFNLTISGESFVDAAVNPVVDINGVKYTPTIFTNKSITISVPALKVGNYDVRVFKNGKQSNKANFSVKPAQKVASYGGVGTTTVTFTGLGFANAPLANTKSTQGVTINGVQAKIVSWADTKIVAATTAKTVKGQAFTINTLFGPIAGKLGTAVTVK